MSFNALHQCLHSSSIKCRKSSWSLASRERASELPILESAKIAICQARNTFEIQSNTLLFKYIAVVFGYIFVFSKENAIYLYWVEKVET